MTSFPFRELPIDLQRFITQKMDVLDRYFFMLCSKSVASHIEIYQPCTRFQLIELAAAEDNLRRLCYLLPPTSWRGGYHWITTMAVRNPHHFWRILGYGVGVGDYYRNADSKIKIIGHLLDSSNYTANSITKIIGVALSVLFVEDFYLIPLIIELSHFQLKLSCAKKVLIMLTRAGRVALTVLFLNHFVDIPHSMLNSAMRVACSINMVLEFNPIFLPFYK